jgi:hypothetical protein
VLHSKLIAEINQGIVSEREVARIKRAAFAARHNIGPSLHEGKTSWRR